MLLAGGVSIARAEVETDEDAVTTQWGTYSFSGPETNHELGFLFFTSSRRDVDADEHAPLPLPRFLNPYENLSDEQIKEDVSVLSASEKVLHIAQELHPEKSVEVIPDKDVGVDILLPRNRCELGTIRWGSQDEGYSQCKVLGRGETLFGSLKLLAGLKATQKTYKSWQIGEMPTAVLSSAIKYKEHFGTDKEYGYCMYRPESESNGATLTTRPDTTIANYYLDTGSNIHPGKDKWGKDAESRKFLLPVRMTKIQASANQKYSNEGMLIYRNDFWIHSYEDAKDSMPLEAHSTWGCPRVSHSCMKEIQEWVATQNEKGIKPLMRVRQEEAPLEHSEPVVFETLDLLSGQD